MGAIFGGSKKSTTPAVTPKLQVQARDPARRPMGTTTTGAAGTTAPPAALTGGPTPEERLGDYGPALLTG